MAKASKLSMRDSPGSALVGSAGAQKRARPLAQRGKMPPHAFKATTLQVVHVRAGAADDEVAAGVGGGAMASVPLLAVAEFPRARDRRSSTRVVEGGGEGGDRRMEPQEKDFSEKSHGVAELPHRSETRLITSDDGTMPPTTHSTTHRRLSAGSSAATGADSAGLVLGMHIVHSTDAGYSHASDLEGTRRSAVDGGPPVREQRQSRDEYRAQGPPGEPRGAVDHARGPAGAGAWGLVAREQRGQAVGGARERPRRGALTISEMSVSQGGVWSALGEKGQGPMSSLADHRELDDTGNGASRDDNELSALSMSPIAPSPASSQRLQRRGAGTAGATTHSDVGCVGNATGARLIDAGWESVTADQYVGSPGCGVNASSLPYHGESILSSAPAEERNAAGEVLGVGSAAERIPSSLPEEEMVNHISSSVPEELAAQDPAAHSCRTSESGKNESENVKRQHDAGASARLTCRPAAAVREERSSRGERGKGHESEGSDDDAAGACQKHIDRPQTNLTAGETASQTGDEKMGLSLPSRDASHTSAGEESVEIHMAQPVTTPAKSMGVPASQDNSREAGSESASVSVSLPTSMLTDVSHPSQGGEAISGAASREGSTASTHGAAAVHGGAPQRNSSNGSKGKGAVRFACVSDTSGLQTDDPSRHGDSAGRGAAGTCAPLTNQSTRCRVWRYVPPAPTLGQLREEAEALNTAYLAKLRPREEIRLPLPEVVYSGPFYSRLQDVPRQEVRFAGRTFRIGSSHKSFLPEFSSLLALQPDAAPCGASARQPLGVTSAWVRGGVAGHGAHAHGHSDAEAGGARRGSFIYRPVRAPPSRKATERWLRAHARGKAGAAARLFETADMQIDSAGRLCFNPVGTDGDSDFAANTPLDDSAATGADSQGKRTQSGSKGASASRDSSAIIRELLDQRPPSPRYDESFLVAASYAPMSQGAAATGSESWSQESDASHFSHMVDSPVKCVSLKPSSARMKKSTPPAASKRAACVTLSDTAPAVPHAQAAEASLVECHVNSAAGADADAAESRQHAAPSAPKQAADAEGVGVGGVGGGRGAGSTGGGAAAGEHTGRGVEKQTAGAVAAEGGGYLLTLLSLEAQCESRRPNKALPALHPDPRVDAVRAICYVIQEEGRALLPRRTRGSIVCVPPGTTRHVLGLPPGIVCRLVHSELALYQELDDLLRDCDPDILVGFEVQQCSFGYVLDRAGHIGFPLDRSLSRCPMFRSVAEKRPDQYGQSQQSGIHICGREILNVWRICRNEIKLAMYTYPHVCEKVLNKRVPVYSYGSCHTWFEGTPPRAGAPPLSAREPAPAPGQVQGAGAGGKDSALDPAPALADAAVDDTAGASAALRPQTTIDVAGESECFTATLMQSAAAAPQNTASGAEKQHADADLHAQPRAAGGGAGDTAMAETGGTSMGVCAAGAEPGGGGGGVQGLEGVANAASGEASGGVQVEMGRRRHMRRVLSYHLERAENSLAILDAMELVGRTCELARVFGIDMFSVLSRGSQYRVESMLYRLARSQNYVLPSPSIQQRQAQPATECIPLVMEPMSAYYDSPVCVLDFRSLYPSVVIAYNLCYSTCLGKAGSQPDAEGHVKLGVTSFARPPGMLAAVQEDTFVTPNGVIYLQSHVREGVLPRLLREILSARVAVKKLMKEALRVNNMALYRALNARQFGLKLIANVTYGYTSAGFSGRMPCAELADSIVQTGRESLERAIRTVESMKKEWGARVVYGDTDSLFVELPGRSKEEAFRVGKQIAAYITAQNPPPMELELEKVYLPSMMVAKKRYVGYSYDAPSATPSLDPKGIEMVRRDGCALLSRVQEKCLRELFETNDLSRVKRFWV